MLGLVHGAALREPLSPYRAIADRLNAEGVPTVAGGVKWHPNSVRSVAERAA